MMGGVLLIAGCASLPPQPMETDLGWPTSVDADGLHLLIYQPQVDSWQGNRLMARSAVTITRELATTPVSGLVTFSARTDVDKETRLVTLNELEITGGSFSAPDATDADLLRAVRDSVGRWPRTIELDRLQASLAITQAEQRAPAIPLENTPPRIFYSRLPAVLIRIDGEPAYRAVQGTSLSRIINTPALVLRDASTGQLYLDGRTRWMTATTLDGPWILAQNPPSALDAVRAQLAKQEHADGGSGEPSDSAVPGVFVSTTPAELIETDGDPQFAAIPGTDLEYVTNTEDEVFLDQVTRQYYVLLAGRWFQAASLDGPWQWVPGTALPPAFAQIPTDSPKARVRASVPGTPETRDAVIDSQIPQTAAVKRSEAKLDVRYDGAPVFKPIAGTRMEYAANSATDVIRLDGRYYAVSQGVWFASNSPSGPWVVADAIPPVIYTIPPSSPLYHVRYVYLYGSTPDVVYVGYTPGYLGAFVSDGTVVFGTGWEYPSWVGDVYFGAPWTWGLGFGLEFWGGGWFWGPWHHDSWYHDWPWTHRLHAEHWHPDWRRPGGVWARNNVNVYHRWANRAVVTDNHPSGLRPGGPAGPPGPHPDLYAGRDGRVYRHGSDGWHQHEGGSWSRVERPSPELEGERAARSLGEARAHAFHSGGGLHEAFGGHAGGFGGHAGGFGGGFGGHGGGHR
jgi:hypothetical protein